MRNMTPADELAVLRSEIRALRAREAQLRNGFLSGRLDPCGTEARVVVKESRRRVLRQDRLPPDLLADPRNWETRLCRVVQLAPAPGAAGPPAPPDDDDYDVIEPC